MGHLSFFTAAFVGGGAVASTGSGENTPAVMVSRSQQMQQRQRRRRPNTLSRSMSLLSLVALLLFISAFAEAQEDCNCSPVEYTFELKLDEITCPDPPLVGPAAVQTYFGPGVKDYTCNPESGLPVKITTAQFVVLDPSFTAITTETKDDIELENGDSLTFTSPTTNPPLVGGILLTLIGEGESGQQVQNTWSIKFTNECGVIALQDGTELGLVVFRDLGRPSQALCPRDDPTSPDNSLSYSRVFSKAGKGSKHTRHSSSKSGKNSKMGGGKSGKSSRRVLRTATSANAEIKGLAEKQSVKEEGLNDEVLPLRRRRLHA